MKIVLSLLAVLSVLLLLAVFGSAEGSAQVPPTPLIILNETCTTIIELPEAPNGLAGFSIIIDVPVISGITTSQITVDETSFPLQSIVPPQSMRVSGTDLNQVIQAGATKVVLFSVFPCIDRATILILDDDNGDPIVPSGTEVFP